MSDEGATVAISGERLRRLGGSGQAQTPCLCRRAPTRRTIDSIDELAERLTDGELGYFVGPAPRDRTGESQVADNGAIPRHPRSPRRAAPAVNEAEAHAPRMHDAMVMMNSNAYMLQ